MTGLDPRTPVLVGVGEVSERIGEPGYRGRSPVELGADAARAALEDTGVDPADVAAALDVVAAVRQFEISLPDVRAPFGRSDNYPRSVAARIGATPRRAILEVVGGQAPQHLVTELCGLVAAGGAQVALVVGAEAISTVQHLLADPAADRPDWTEHVDGDLEDRGLDLRGIISARHAAHGLTDTASQYALVDTARRARLGLTRDEYVAAIGRLFAPFTEVAARTPHAAAPVVRSAEELATPSDRNRPIADPYLRYVVAREKVAQGAAVLVTSVGAAGRLGIPADRWVYLHGHADLRERDLLDRPDLGASPAATFALRHALEVAGIGPDELTFLDLYSCYAAPVFVAAEALGIAPDDPRGLTVTGGLPFFGGPGNNYSTHAVARTVHLLRASPGSYGLVGANGGVLSKYSAGVYSTRPAPWRPDRSAQLQEEVDAAPAPGETVRADGPAVVETCTVRHDRSGDRTGIVVARLADGRRVLARTVDGDDETLDLLSGAAEPVGARVEVRSTGRGSRVATGRRRMDVVLPRRAVGFREDYEFLRVHRDGHLLEVTIDRPEARNALHPPANEELDEVFDAFFADRDLWVAIITGAGDKAFSAGNDLVYSASGRPMWAPLNGFGGLTSRSGMTKPVIAAVNGWAMGGGFEIALACHLVVADETATFALSEVKVGLVAAGGGIVRLPRVLPPKLATEMILTGRRMGAAEAHRLGLVNRVAPAGQALAAARALAAEILDGSPTSVRVSLAVLAATAGAADPVEAARMRPPELDELMVTQDALEGMRAFAEKRRPRWRNG